MQLFILITNELSNLFDIYNKAKDLREQNQPGNPKTLDEFLREGNISPMDATTVQSKEHIRQNSDDR